MPINRPTTKTIISTQGWGIPITDEVNRVSPIADNNATRIGALETATADSGWITMVLTGGWVAYDAPRAPRYRKIGKLVTCIGVMKNGSLNQIAFTLPVGYRPAMAQTFAVNSTQTGTGVGEAYLCALYPDGRIVPTSGGNTWFYLDGCTFMIA